jgi:hypothetical protein
LFVTVCYAFRCRARSSSLIKRAMRVRASGEPNRWVEVVGEVEIAVR